MDIWDKLKTDLAEGYLSKDEIKLIQELRDKFNRINTIASIPTPRIESTINWRNLRDTLKNNTGAEVILADNLYYLIKGTELLRFLSEDKVDLEKYVSEFKDCDDFAWALLGAVNTGAWSGIAFGFAWSDTHAFNIFVNHKRQVFIVEPQNDMVKQVKYLKRDRDYYPIRLVMM